MSDLQPIFVAELAPDHAAQAGAIADLEERLRALARAGGAAWDGIALADADFVAHLARCIPDDRDVASFLDAVAAEELYLACACARQDRAGLDAMERQFGRSIDRAVSMLKHEYLSADDLKQIVRNKLYVGTEDVPPAIARYNGLGTLGGWLRVLATRAGLNAIRPKVGGAGWVPDPAALEPVLADPELDYLKGTYREAFKEAFVAAVAGLKPRERTLLRQALVHDLTVREIGRMYSVHYATASRWIADARRQLAETTRSELAERLGLSQEQLDSIMRLIHSRIDVSIARVLGPEKELS